MSERKHLTDREIEALVRAHLAQQEGTVDAARIVAGVRARMAADALTARASGPPVPARTFSRSLRYGWRLALAASVMLIVFWGLQINPGQAGATTLVQEAQKVHALPVDRCYEIQTQVEPALMDTYRVLPQRKARLWTRGDRFWMEPLQGNRQWSMGQDETGRVWFACSGQHGFRFEAEEVPEPLRIACELRTMRVETLLHEVLVDFDLREEKPRSGGSMATRIVQATLKPDRRRPLRAVTMEMDGESKVLRRVVLSRTHPIGASSTVTFTLVAEDHQKDDAYRMEGHLGPEAHIYSTEEPPPRRLRLLRRQFESAGSGVEN